MPFVLGRATFGGGLPAQLIAGQTTTTERFREGFASLNLRPILGVAEEAEAVHPALDEMFGDELPSLRVILHHMGEGRIPTAQGEVDGRFVGLADEVGQVIAGAQPGQDTVAIPAPRDYLLVDDAVRGQVPAVFGRVRRDALEQTMVVPTEGEQDVSRAFHAGE